MTKKKEEVVFYERFLIAKAKTAPTITIAAIIAMVEIAKYISVGGCAAIGWGVGVVGDGSTSSANAEGTKDLKLILSRRHRNVNK